MPIQPCKTIDGCKAKCYNTVVGRSAGERKGTEAYMVNKRMSTSSGMTQPMFPVQINE